MSGPEGDPAFEDLLEFLKRARGIDFTGYKRASLERRFARRLALVGVGGYGEYLDYLEVHPEEFEQLFDTMLINVTEFFRDPPAWDMLRERVLPELAALAPEEPIRVWSAGCASGQEAFTLAMVFAEVLGEDAFRQRVKIYATDIDEEALSTARLATYTPKQVESVPSELRERYFEPVDQRYAFRKDLRRSVIFGRNNLIEDAPISRLSLLVCRNTLMYFTAETQARIVRHFHFALAERGVLMLGKSEMMIAHRDLFTPIELKTRIFAREGGEGGPARPRATPAVPEVVPAGRGEGDELGRAALDVAGIAQLVVSRAGVLASANSAARALLGVGADHLGRPFGELEVSFRPTSLRDAVDEVLRERREVSVGRTTLPVDGGTERRLEVSVSPLLSGDTALGASITFEDVTRVEALREEVAGNRRDLELAYEELQSTIDELETTNEELQSANEELQTTNEELQSTNEELETINEELQSTNEELETINDELRERTTELNQVNELFEAILTSLGVGVAVLDAHGRVQVWSRLAEDLWGVRQAEVAQQHFMALDIGLPVERLAPALRQVLGGVADREEIVLESVNRRGRSFACRTTVMPLAGPAGSDGPGGAVVVMAESDGG